MLLTETCYYLENHVFGGVNNWDMSLIETCFYSRLYGRISFGDMKKYWNWVSSVQSWPFNNGFMAAYSCGQPHSPAIFVLFLHLVSSIGKICSFSHPHDTNDNVFYGWPLVKDHKYSDPIYYSKSEIGFWIENINQGPEKQHVIY